MIGNGTETPFKNRFEGALFYCQTSSCNLEHLDRHQRLTELVSLISQLLVNVQDVSFVSVVRDFRRINPSICHGQV